MATLFVEKLVNLDFTRFDSVRGLVGETQLVDLTLRGPQNDQGMILDFGDIKQKVVQVLESAVDHMLVLPLQAQSSDGLEAVSIHCANHLNSGHYQLNLKSQRAQYSLLMPEPGFTALDMAQISPENLTSYLQGLLTEQPWWSEQWSVMLRLYSEPQLKDQDCFFSYTHGLSKHQGACQRIAHGHRSKMAIYINDAYDLALTQQWCQRWADIYIGSRQVLESENALNYEFAYQSPEGTYCLTVPKHNTYMIDTETTIEHIAQHLADAVARDINKKGGHTNSGVTAHSAHPPISIKTRVYEGYNKGAEGYAQLFAQLNSAQTGQ